MKQSYFKLLVQSSSQLLEMLQSLVNASTEHIKQLTPLPQLSSLLNSCVNAFH
jgi:hypothetical protein